MRVSVVISTYNRAESLRATLDALHAQTHEDFEVIVVAGPCEDGTDDLLAERAHALRVVRCPEPHLSRSRNLGIDAAAGEIVAFIDDDAVPEPDWLSGLVAAYDAPDVGGAGGLVMDHTGAALQYGISTCTRAAETCFDEDEVDVDAATRPGADPFLYLQGTNASFRRSVLEEVHGFDEEIAYMHDETELAAMIIDAGHRLVPVDGAAVHHRYLPSHLRKRTGFTDPYHSIKNRAYVALRLGAGRVPEDEIVAAQERNLEEVTAWAQRSFEDGSFTAAELHRFHERGAAGLQEGLRRGREGDRRGRPIAPAPTDAFLPYPTLRPNGPRLGIVFLSQDYPPRPMGGIARFTVDLATGLAARGHEVHVVTQSDPPHRVDLEDGVWVHRHPVAERWLPDVDRTPLRHHLDRLAAIAGATGRILSRRPIDVVTGPLWGAEPLLLDGDGRATVALTCMTPLRTVTAMQPRVEEHPATAWQIALEDASLLAADWLQPISHANLETVCEVPGVAGRPARVTWLGIRDAYDPGARSRPADDGITEILFVGRLEARKGVDTLLRAAAAILPSRPAARVRLIGADNSAWSDGERYEDLMAEWCHGDASVLSRVIFDGAVDDDALAQAYADADVFCVPSRYESFGLVMAEAMMHGLPVASCRIGGIEEVVADGETGLLVEPGDHEDLARVLATMIDEPERRQAMGAAGRARYEAEFDNEVAVDRVEAFYAELAQARTGPVPAAPAALAGARERARALVARLAHLGEDAAARVADAVTDPRRFPVDPVPPLRRALGAPDPAFVDEVHLVLLGRWATPREGEAVMAALRGGTARSAIVREVAARREAVRRFGGPPPLDGLPVVGDEELLDAVAAAWLHGPDDAFARALVAATAGEEAQDAVARAERDLADGVSRTRVLEGLLADPRTRTRTLHPEIVLTQQRMDAEAVLSAIRAAADAPADVFVDTVYRTLLRRPVDPAGLADGLRRLRAEHRAAFVLAVAGTEEAARRGVTPALVAGLAAQDGPLTTAPRGVRVRSAAPVQRVEGALARARADLRIAARSGEEVGERLDGRLASLEAALSAAIERLDALGAQNADLAREADRQRVLLERVLATGARTLAQSRERPPAVEPPPAIDPGEITRLAWEVAAQGQRLDVLLTKQEGMALDLRERVAVAPDPGIPDPAVPDPAALAERLEQTGGRVNLGCGEKPLEDYVNVDGRPLPGVDVVADVRRLPFAPGTLTEVASFHLVEHFRQHQLTTVILPAWRELLVPGGVLRTVTPNWEALIAQLQAGEIPFEQFKTVTFGLQDYAGDDHFALYSPDTLRSVLEAAGFTDVEVVVVDRQNGNTPEMELLARAGRG